MASDVISNVILGVREDWEKSPRSINGGDCTDFACELMERLDSREMEIEKMDTPEAYGVEDCLVTEPYHMWITDGSRHYDAEAPEGVSDWKELPFFQRELCSGW